MGKHAAPVARRTFSPRGRTFSPRARGLVRLGSFIACGAVVTTVLMPALADGPGGFPGTAASSLSETELEDRAQDSVSRDQARVTEIASVDELPSNEVLIPKEYHEFSKDLLASPDFKVASFNVLGASHTKKGGNRPGYASGVTRVRWVLDLLNSHSVSVVGVQEMQMEQFNVFMGASNNSWGAYPGPAGGRGAVQNSVLWRKSTWKLVRAETTPIPYFGGRRIAMPHVLLEHIASGRRVWFGNYHNPADSHGGAQHWRNLATTMEANLANRLMRETGYPVIMTGDFNDREAFICPFTRQADAMHSADGAHSDASGCHAPRGINVDWIIGSAQIAFTSFLENRSPLVERTSDHPMIIATVSLRPAIVEDDCILDDGVRLCPPANP